MNLSALEQVLGGSQLTEGSTSQYNMGVIVAGVGRRAIQGDNDGAGDRLRKPQNWDVWGA